jgi:hypothetical protein
MTRIPFAPVALIVLAVAAACSDDSSGPEAFNVNGQWAGTAALGTQGRSTNMTLTQSGAAVTGTMSLTGVMVDRPLTGTVTGDQFAWFVGFGCERWAGLMNASADRRQVSGSITQDLTNCAPPRSGTSGTLTLDRR